jgi:hypothetical protein
MLRDRPYEEGGRRGSVGEPFDPCVWCLKSELGTSVINQVELNITSSSDLLPFLLRWSEDNVFSKRYYGNVGSEERRTTILNEGEDLLFAF